ncbi:SDR family NAD(P)-dependent oxidoreductase [Jannaschia aquimarina]|uniref:FabG_6 protein n=1 Tax=Jannaschia aquimarina TaxID=935700 RepID=A0A0D1DAE6_9RHOB|nr:SDR family NAD(P)-dependent oxidoreductase [Jannaschia aquimarina]KIT16888.1 3-oxoacyl-[acyl-carrier-protein] reductase FabG [Jannaschia aquimarina]SNT12289.1 3-oxoacyl-[acyl-carrier protein] reductase [Jannaschia aquimarina]
MTLDGQIAVVTGAAQGIGAAVMRGLTEAGARVASWDSASHNAQTCEALGTLAVACDVTDEASIAEALAATERDLGAPSILVHSAGIAGSNAPVTDYDPAEFRRIVDVNLTGTFLVNRAVARGMRERGYGRILNIASVAGKEGNPNACAYSASKAGVIGFTKSLGKEMADVDVAVNCVTPAAARTPIFEQMSQEHIDYMLSKIPRARFLEVEEAAEMIVWCVSPANSFTTGAVFDLSGGRATY